MIVLRRYPPGESVDPSKTTGPWHSREWFNLSEPSTPGAFELPPQQIGGAHGGGFWPPKPAFQVNSLAANRRNHQRAISDDSPRFPCHGKRRVQ